MLPSPADGESTTALLESPLPAAFPGVDRSPIHLRKCGGEPESAAGKNNAPPQVKDHGLAVGQGLKLDGCPDTYYTHITRLPPGQRRRFSRCSSSRESHAGR